MPEPVTRRKAVNLPLELVREIDAYRSTRRPIPSESAAIRDLLIRGLETLKDEQQRPAPRTRRKAS
jgi:hypothetical protein